MANLNKPFGFRPVRSMFSRNVHPNRYTIASTYATALNIGQPVVLAGSGRDIAVGAGTNETLLGVFAGCEYWPSDNTQEPVYGKRWPGNPGVKAGTIVEAFVWDDPDIIFQVQADGVLAAADVGLNVDYNVGSPDTLLGYAGSTIAVAGKAGTNTLLWRILGLTEDANMRPAGNAWGAYAVVDVRMNVSAHRATTGA